MIENGQSSRLSVIFIKFAQFISIFTEESRISLKHYTSKVAHPTPRVMLICFFGTLSNPNSVTGPWLIHDLAGQALAVPGEPSWCCGPSSSSSHSFWFVILQLSTSRIASCKMSLGVIDFLFKTCSYLAFQIYHKIQGYVSFKFYWLVKT